MEENEGFPEVPKKRRFHGSFKEDVIKKARREDNRKQVIEERGIGPGIQVRVKGRSKIWTVKRISDDNLVQLEGGSIRIPPDEIEVVNDE